MKKIFSTLLIAFILLFPKSVLAHGGEMSLEDEIQEIFLEQHVNNIDDIDCATLSDERLEEIGDAVMSQAHPDTEEHERMDKMMGGEGSEQLKNAHIGMARSYLRCAKNNTDTYATLDDNKEKMRGGAWGMMGYYGQESMMNGNLGGLLGGIGLLIWIAILVDLILLGVWLWKQIQKK